MNQELINTLLDKSEEAFLMAIEIYNKPTINYRLEGFAFFICNAWELLLKSKMLQNNESIYYPDKPNRTISLSNCITNVFTNDKDPVRKNLEILVGLRNTSTHFVIKEMDSIYLPFMQANVLNYSQKLFDYFGRDITQKINSSFMTLVINNEEVSEENILSRYGDNIFNRYYKMKDETKQIIAENANEKLAIKVDLNVKIVKDKEEAKTTFRIAKDGEEPVSIIKELKDTNLTHCYNQKRIREIEKEKQNLKYVLLPLLSILITVILVGESWWARYVPQLYFISIGTITMLIYMRKYNKKMLISLIPYILITPIVLNMGCFIYSNYNHICNILIL